MDVLINPIISVIRQRGLTQDALARAINEDPTALHRVVTGRRTCPRIAQAAADYLGLPLAEFFPKAAAAIERKKLKESRRRRPARPSKEQYEALCKEVKKTMVDLGLDRRGSHGIIAARLTAHMGRRVSANTICAVLSQLLVTGDKYNILLALKTMFSSWTGENGN